ncbi:MAG TPA: hypothetical protein PKV80_27960 [Leptospiraceae bacterium]|nr:hypothetical protein [Leptospiraceae bacterium]HNO26004.1 hypothetical protein [Leptospiraceae bacterium]
MSEKKQIIDQKLEQISERVYWQSFAFFCFVVLTAIAGTGFLRFYKDSLIELVPKNVLDFTERVIWVYVIPITVKVLKDSIPMLTGLVRELKELRAQISNSGNPQETAIQNGQTNQMNQMEVSNVNN